MSDEIKNTDLNDVDMIDENKQESLFDHKWYILQTRAGCENSVRNNLLIKAKDSALKDYIVDVIVQNEEKIKLTPSGKKKVVLVNKYPTYVFIKMQYSDEVWRHVIQTEGATSFVGPAGRPKALTLKEVRRNNLEYVEQEIELKIGDEVSILTGPFETKVGTICGITPAVNENDVDKVTVMLAIFGRDTKLEFEKTMVDKI